LAYFKFNQKKGDPMKTFFAGAALSVLAFAATPAMAGFINGGFEDNNFNGWTQGGGSRAGELNPLSPTDYLPGGSQYNAGSGRSAIIASGYVDPIIGTALGDTVYGGGYGARIEDTTYGGNASVISQKVTNYTDATIFFAWKAVLENGGHSDNASAIFELVLRDLTTGTDIVSRSYNAGAGGGGVDPRFTELNGLFYTTSWQIEALNIDAGLSGHDFELTVLAADCQPTGHTGYAYIDGFGARIPDPDPNPVPEPASFGLLGLGLIGLGFARIRKAA
jgi:PEP-CTERM motif